MLTAGCTVTAVNFAVAAGSDQTTGDSVSIVNFENLDASAMTTALNVTGSSGANVVTTGSGDDTIRGGGGADIISAGAGNDAVDYWGTEVSIDGGTGTNTLVVRASATLDLSATDQSAGDLATVTNFQNVDASGLTATQVVSVMGSSGANVITGGAGADIIDGDGGVDVISAGAGNDTVIFHGTEASVDGGAGSDTLVLMAGSTMTAVDFSVTAGNDQTSGDSYQRHEFRESGRQRADDGAGRDRLVRRQHDPDRLGQRHRRRRRRAWTSSAPVRATIRSPIAAPSCRSTAAPEPTR